MDKKIKKRVVGRALHLDERPIMVIFRRDAVRNFIFFFINYIDNVKILGLQ